MRRVLAALAVSVLSACAAPPSDGGLWVQQGIEAERAAFRISGQERAAAAREVENALADELLARERARLDAHLADCPGQQRGSLMLSEGNRTRDLIRIRVADDQQRLASLSQLALADWRARRAAATGESALCEAGRAALAGQYSPGDAVQMPDLQGLSAVAIGYADPMSVEPPLSHYLAAVYGGAPPPSAVPIRASEDEVDGLAQAFPGWEPDAIWLTLLAGSGFQP